MGKRGMQSDEAMGVSAYEMLEKQLGHGKIKNVRVPTFRELGSGAAAAESTELERTVFARKGASREETLSALDKLGLKRERVKVQEDAVHALNSRFSNMRKAFQFMDVDNSGRIALPEIERAMHMWGLGDGMTKDKLRMLLVQCDSDGDGHIDYKEFVDHLARDTVAPAAMGKRGMQSDEAMGVSAYEMLEKQLGHGPKPKNVMS
jgi:Ca2+-binding EF-hand superfamily protein